jgi:hypothetical protein
MHRLHKLALPKADSGPKALAYYGLLARETQGPDESMWLRFVADRPVSAMSRYSSCQAARFWLPM